MTASKTMKDYTDYVVKQCDGDNTVTLVRRRTVYEEKVVTLDEYLQLNKQLSGEDTDEFPSMYASEIQGFESIGFDDFEEEETKYIAFPSDVTSFTDDAIGFMFQNQPWSDGYGMIPLASND